MKSIFKLLIAVVLVTITGRSFAATATYDMRVDDRHLSGFNAVSVSGSFDVYITQGSTESVKVEAPDEVIDKIITEVNGTELRIYNKRGFNWDEWFGGKNKKIAIYVSIKDVNGISLSGSGDVFFKEGLTANSLRLSLTGSGDIYGKIDVKSLETRVVGSGDIKIGGRAESSTVSVTGSGDYNGHGVVTQRTSVHVAGSGDAEVNVTDSLEASVSGSGDVHYTGSPKHIMTSKAGSGDIERN